VAIAWALWWCRGIVLFSVNQANKALSPFKRAKVANQDSLVSLVTASGEIKRRLIQT